MTILKIEIIKIQHIQKIKIKNLKPGESETLIPCRSFAGVDYKEKINNTFGGALQPVPAQSGMVVPWKSRQSVFRSTFAFAHLGFFRPPIETVPQRRALPPLGTRTKSGIQGESQNPGGDGV